MADKNKKLVVLTGAGISAESGISTFRDSGGLWEKHRVEDVASPSGFARDPHLVWNFYKASYLQSLEVEPNPGTLPWYGWKSNWATDSHL
jgi:NAD-dependent deacetylase